MLSNLTAIQQRVVAIEQSLAAIGGSSGTTAGFAAVLDEAISTSASKSSSSTTTTGLTRTSSATRATSSSKNSTAFDALIQRAATKYGVDADLVHAVIQAESDYNPNCRSSAGALGLMQLMPGTARSLGVSNALDPASNIDGGVRYLRGQLDRFGEVDLALAAYNAGPNAVSRYKSVPPYRETQGYVRRVMQTLWQRKGVESADRTQ